VAIGSPREVNLDIDIRGHTAEKMLNPTHDTFDRAQKRIQSLMEKDSYPRFLESELYKNLTSSQASNTPSHAMSNTSLNESSAPGTSGSSHKTNL
jgi:hypothetical protein